MTEFGNLIPDMQKWSDTGFDIESWLTCSGSFPLAIGYSLIFWPSFVEFEGYVLRDGFSVDGLRMWEAQPGIERQQIEGTINHFHIADMHEIGSDVATKEQLVYLGRKLREIYQAKLAWQFPHLTFEVWFNDVEEVEKLIDYQLHLLPGGLQAHSGA